jgi:hypothetical protein
MTATTNAKYTKVFLATMAAMGVTDEAQMEMFWKMEETKSNVSSALKACRLTPCNPECRSYSFDYIGLLSALRQ